VRAGLLAAGTLGLAAGGSALDRHTIRHATADVAPVGAGPAWDLAYTERLFDAAPPPRRALRVEKEPAFTVHELLPDAPRTAIALTIDDGPDPQWTPQVLGLLAKYRIKATFSLVGVHVAQAPHLAKEIVERGHAVANHTMHHLQPFASLSRREVVREVAEAQSLISGATGRVPSLFRAPGGDWSPVVFEAIAARGLRPIDWDVDPRDWSLPGVAFIARALLAAKPGDILLCHDGGGFRRETVTALDEVLPVLLRRGLTFVSLDPREASDPASPSER
jgi:peptidoglycan/xylan/chitin deacetylase (PgdA/CDA1 family)